VGVAPQSQPTLPSDSKSGATTRTTKQLLTRPWPTADRLPLVRPPSPLPALPSMHTGGRVSVTDSVTGHPLRTVWNRLTSILPHATDRARGVSAVCAVDGAAPPRRWA
jgi:hypothetical protein